MRNWPPIRIWETPIDASSLHSCTDIVSAIGISAISAKNIGIGYQQYYKMYIGNQNFTFLWENWP